MTTEREIEQEIQSKNLNAPRLSPEKIDAVIAGSEYHLFNGCVTVCCLTLQNGYSVVGKSAPASPQNFDVDLGRKIAFDDARRQIWALEGYLLKSKLKD